LNLCNDLYHQRLGDIELPKSAKELAFYMVRHSVPRPEHTRGMRAKSLSVQRLFRPLVEEMREDNDLKGLFENPHTGFVVEGDE
jgi:hypothetical protein